MSRPSVYVVQAASNAPTIYTDPFADIPLIKRACSCESWGDPNKEPREFYPDGTLVIGKPNPADIGACQINTTLWQTKANQLGYNLRTLQGNVDMAKYIYSVQGIEAWKWSEGCWGTK